MKFQTELVLFIIGACSLIALTNANCPIPRCFDCNRCQQNCSNLRQDCDSDCIAKTREFLCKLEVQNCIKIQHCDIPSVPITFYPAAYYDVSRPAWQPETLEVRPNCCYKLTGKWDNTLSSLKTNGACVILFDGYNCNGQRLQIDSNTTEACLSWIDCASRLSAGGQKFNDKASSFRLC